ncbi:MAG: nucleotidyltransferase domain-containing protein [Polyangiaceae bacterium]|nr:nucleotidyltransferase domain-containing protein [Polyangiaceae bacterium]
MRAAARASGVLLPAARRTEPVTVIRLPPAVPDLDLNAIERVVSRHPGVALAYLFGSRARGTARPDSDLDLAVLWDATLDSRERAERESELRASLVAALGPLGERADLLDLAAAGAAVGFRVIREGRLLACADDRARVAFVARLARRYDDEAPYRALFRAAARRAGQKMAEAVRDRS